jgi:phospholipid/cholesterol/gamma-HCH transport system ATP-binding protein
MATHEVETAFQISDRIAMMHEGKMAHVGTPEEIRSKPDPEIHEFIDEALARADRKQAQLG